MANNLETRTGDYDSTFYNSENIPDLSYDNGLEYVVKKPETGVYIDPVLSKFTGSIKDKKRRKELEGEINRLHKQYVESIKKNSGAPGRAALLEHSYNFVPEDDEIEGKNAREVLEKRLYSTPGRHYQYLNGVVGDKKKSKDIKYEIGKAAKYAIKEGWPILGAGAGWMLANRWYNKGGAKKKVLGLSSKEEINNAFKPLHKPWEYAFPITGPANLAGDIGMAIAKRKAKKQIQGGIVGRAARAYDNPFWEYLGPKGVIRFGADTGKLLIGEGLRAGWKLIRTPALYAIGAYAAYKVISYLIKRRKEKKLEHEEVERLENMRNEMLAQRQMFYPRSEMGMAA